MVFQFNKQDLPPELVMDAEVLEESLNFRGAPSFPADALHGGGVFETLKAASSLVLRRLARPEQTG